jgi:hypothetical protein
MSLHAWEKWVEPEIRKTLMAGREHLRRAWEHDQTDKNSYPINTAWALAQIRERVSGRPASKKPKTLRLRFKRPTTLAELVPDDLIKSVWEENHNSSFESAIMQADDTNDDKHDRSRKAFKGIIRAIEIAYFGRYWGWELLRRPKVSILHRGLDEIARRADLGGTEKGFVEFLDDLCPCGLKHKEAVRKLMSRSETIRRPKR